jgi:hypothetical protein
MRLDYRHVLPEASRAMSRLERVFRISTPCRPEATEMAKPVDREISVPTEVEPAAPQDHPFDAEIEGERAGWYELLELVHSLDPAEIARPGYYRDPDWSVADLVAHLGTWLAEAGIQLRRIEAGTYRPRDLDIDALNAEFRAAMSGQPWEVILTQAQASRYRMLRVWYALPSRTAAAAWWVAKAGPDHYREHLGRLRTWVSELHAGPGRHPHPRSRGARPGTLPWT